jgi:hypothetical membrane protein
MRNTAAWCWILATPLFLAANVITALAWDPAYIWATGNISDLGNATCGLWDTTRPRYVCSPLHGFMNVAVLLTAVLLAVGAVSLLRGRLARVLLLLTSLGYALAGLYPADVDENIHFLGALLILVFGNVALAVAAFALRDELRPWLWLRDWTLVLSGIAIVGTVLFFTQNGLGIGVGGMERIAVLPLLVWASVVGLQTLVSSSAASGLRRAVGSPSTPRRSLPLRSHEMPKAHTEMTSPT